MPPTVHRATLADLDGLAPLFDAYRVFYRKASDREGARAFLHDRLSRDESVVFAARLGEGPLVGFTQLYPSFSSVQMRRVWVLNDLFVAEGARKQGVAQALMAEAEAFARETGAAWVQLETEATNAPAQALYDGLGWERDREHWVYTRPLG